MLPTLKDFNQSKLNIVFKDNDIMKRLSILSMSARYDNSCSSSGGKRETHPYGLGNSHLSGICHSWASDGRCVSLLKILMTNTCINDCKYCINRIKNDVPRAILSPQEIATLTVEFYRRNYIEGLFLSSGIVRNPDYTMELMLNALRILRFKNYFNGYIHLKIIPGASKELVEEAYKLADRVSSNLELPTEESLRMLAPDKNFKELYHPLQLIRDLHNERKQKASASTQLIIGATPDTDKTILSLSDSLYKKKMVRRVYYSAYIPVNKDSELPVIKEPPFLREHRLYQADWLLRFYGFVVDEIFEESDNISLVADPKLQWALRHLDFFPVEITKADYYELLRIPGIGPLSAKKIIKARKYGEITEEFLKKLGVPLKRAKYFLSIKGKPIVKVSKTESRYLEERNLSLFNENHANNLL
ncbi:putative DNA modification/repair radical SAM protein [Thermodesulfovibrio sp.]|uniref:putative DNA modification/repair radical SAM protein n=1 Tax=Thermodesulfovibrio sp. TaxID=2067987 RepID=UPI0030983616